MGRIHPDRSVLAHLKGAEHSFAEILCDGLSDDWLILTRQDLWTPERPFEIDALILHQHFGFLAIEVKGGPFEIRDGLWYRRNERIVTPPPRQAQDAAFALRDALRANCPSLSHVKIAHAVALTDIDELLGGLPPGCTATQLFTSIGIEEIEQQVVGCINASGAKGSLSNEQIMEFISYMLPNTQLKWDPDSRARHSRESLNRICTEQIRALQSLDMNRRVLVTGAAGSGKTRLALAWAHRAAKHGEKTLLACYNDPLANFLKAACSGEANLTVGSFLPTGRELPEIPLLEIPIDPVAQNNFWNVDLITHLLANLDENTTKYDVIVLDERQDFTDDWMSIVELLLEPVNGRVLCVADAAQDIYERGFVIPDSNSGWTRAELRMNCRNTRAIAKFLQQFGGGQAAPSSPEGDPIFFKSVSDLWQLKAAVDQEIRVQVNLLGRSCENILVITGDRGERDFLRANPPLNHQLRQWEQRGGNIIACETFRRAKGVEVDSTIVATLKPNFTDREMYVAASRARTTLKIFGPPEFAARFALNI